MRRPLSVLFSAAHEAADGHPGSPGRLRHAGGGGGGGGRAAVVSAFAAANSATAAAMEALIFSFLFCVCVIFPTSCLLLGVSGVVKLGIAVNND